LPSPAGTGATTLHDGDELFRAARAEAPFERREQAIAEIARSLRDYFLYVAE
jgi:hypothetical protein